MPSEQTLVLRSRRSKEALFFAVSVVFTIGGLLMISDGDATGWLVVIFFGLCIVVFGVNFFKRPSLRLTPEGLTTVSLTKPSTLRWADVKDFRVDMLGHIDHPTGALLDVAGIFVNGLGNHKGSKGVAFDFTDGYKQFATARKFMRKASGYEGALPDTYGMPAEQLAALLNDWRTRFTQASARLVTH
jgi:hypothetical protein